MFEESHAKVLFLASDGRIDVLTDTDFPSSNVTDDILTVSSAHSRLSVFGSVVISASICLFVESLLFIGFVTVLEAELFACTFD